MIDRFPCARAAVYHNTRRLTPAQIKAETGCSHIINGGFFNTDFEPCGWLVMDGKVIVKDAYNDWGFACGQDGAPEMSTDRSRSFLSGVPILKNGQKLERSLTADVARRAERTAVGWVDDGQVLLWCDKKKLTREELQERLIELGVSDALMLDGGGSVQGDFPDGKLLSSRKVATLLLFWEEETKKEETDLADVKTYSLAKNGKTYLSDNFRVREFACNDGSDKVLISGELITLLQKIRNHFGKAVVIKSGYRTSAYNAKVGGTTKSQHLYGTAADIVVADIEPEKVARYAEFLMPDCGGIGVYQTFTHVDVRTGRSRWDSRSGTEQSVSGWPGYGEKSEAELAVEWVTEQGILQGNTDGDLMLDQPLTRRQFAVMLRRYHKALSQP